MTTCLELLQQIPTTKFPTVFQSNRVLKPFDFMQSKIIPRCTISDLPDSHNIIMLKSMSDSNKCHITIYKQGEIEEYTNKHNGQTYNVMSTHCRANVSQINWRSHEVTAVNGEFRTDIERHDFFKLIDWSELFIATYKKERK